MKEVFCTEHPCTCDLGAWFSRIDWALFDRQVKSLAQVEDRMERHPKEYGTTKEAQHLEGLYNMLADLWDLRPETPAQEEDFPRRRTHE